MFEDHEPTRENDTEFIRQLTSSLAQKQLEALGYSKQLEDARNWVETNPNQGGIKAITDTPETHQLIKELNQGIPDAIAKSMVKITDQKEAKKLLAAALFGLKMGEPSSDTLISFRVAAPSVESIQTDFDPNKDSKNKLRQVPNYGGTEELVRNIVTAFLPDTPDKSDKISRAVRQLGWGPKRYTETNGPIQLTIHAPKERLKTSNNSSDWAYLVEASLIQHK